MQDKGKIVDPFVPKFDIQKVNDFSKEIRKSQKINVDSPRFIKTLRRALFEMFQTVDKDNSGKISYQEFHEGFKNLTYGLDDNDIHTLIALADEDEDGLITWEEFVPIGIDAIKTFFARNKVLQRAKAQDREINKEAMHNVYMSEVLKANEIIQKRFKKIDTEEKGEITVFQLKKVLRSSNLLTPKEINSIVRNVKEDTFKYEEFSQTLFNVRVELAKSRLLEANMESI